jgi:hypothetical protein
VKDFFLLAELTDAVRLTRNVFKHSNPEAFITFDAAWSADNIDERFYDYKGLSDVVDKTFVMVSSWDHKL